MDHQNVAQLLGNYGEFFGSIAILVTLVYLAIQVRQSGRATTFAAVQANRAERIAWFQSIRDSPYLPRIFVKLEAGEALDAEETSRLRSHTSALWGAIYSQWLQQELALSGGYTTKDDAMIAMAISLPGATEWFEFNGQRVYPDEFCEYVNARLPTVPPPEHNNIY